MGNSSTANKNLETPLKNYENSLERVLKRGHLCTEPAFFRRGVGERKNLEMALTIYKM
jgi:hypothetical protein